MKGLIIATCFFCAMLFFLSVVNASESITSYTTNGVVSLDTKLVASGFYDNTDSNEQIFCKFVTFDLNTGRPVERLTDQLTYIDGSFYVERELKEPLYFRDENTLTWDYKISVTCGNASADANFSVGQRQSVENQFFAEMIFFKDNGPFLVFAGIIAMIAIVLLGGLAYFIIKSWEGPCVNRR